MKFTSNLVWRGGRKRNGFNKLDFVDFFARVLKRRGGKPQHAAAIEKQYIGARVQGSKNAWKLQFQKGYLKKSFLFVFFLDSTQKKFTIIY